MNKTTHINTSALPRRAHDFLVFRLAGQQYGIELEQVQELCDFKRVDFDGAAGGTLIGAIKLGTRYAPVHLPHACLHLPLPPAGGLEDVVVLRAGTSALGLAVDAVLDVVTLSSSDIRPFNAGVAQTAAQTAAQNVVQSIGSSGTRRILLLDRARLLAALYGAGTRPRLAA